MTPILYLVHRLPFPPDKGDRIRAFHILQFLAKQGPVHLATLADEPCSVAEARAGLSRYCEKLAIIPLPRTRRLRMIGSLVIGRTASEGAFDSPALRAVLRSWCLETRYRVCLVSASSMVPYLQMPELQGVPAIVDLVDVDSQKWLDYAATSRGWRHWVFQQEGLRLRNLEASLLSRARAITLVSREEVNVFQRDMALALPRPEDALGPVGLDRFGIRVFGDTEDQERSYLLARQGGQLDGGSIHFTRSSVTPRRESSGGAIRVRRSKTRVAASQVSPHASALGPAPRSVHDNS